MKTRSSRARLGDILVRAGLVDAEGVSKALDRQRAQPGRFGSQLLKLGLLTEDGLAKALSMQFGVPAFLPSLTEVDRAAVERLPQPVARRARALPFQWDEEKGVLYVAMADPHDLRALDEVRFASGARKVAVQVAPEAVLERLLSRHLDGVETAPASAPEITVTPLPPPAAPGSAPRAPTPARARPEVLVADPDPKRRRAMAALLESSGYRVTRATTPEEARELIERRTWSSAWVHEEWSEAGSGAASLKVYSDPVEALSDASGPLETLRREAAETAEAGALRLLGDKLPPARKAVSLVRFLAARRGIEGLAAECLSLRAWRLALGGWELPPALPSLPGGDIVEAVAAYERALLSGRTPAQASEALRTDSSLDPEAVTSLLRWAVGEDLLSRFEAPPRLLLILPADRAARVSGPLSGAGWAITVADAPPSEEGGWDAVLADMGPGLLVLEKSSKLPTEKRQPIFLLSENLNAPDTMYALKLGAEDVLGFDTHPEVLETKLRRSVSRRAPGQGLVTGNLRDMGLADILQILANGQKTAAVQLAGPAGTGEIALERGSIVDARTGETEGEDALYAMISWEQGDFRIVPGQGARAVTVAGSTEGLLMEAFRRLDEERRAESEDPPEP